MESNLNKTRDDARERVNRGKFSSLAFKPTEEYLEALRQDVYEWLRQIELKLHDVRNVEPLVEESDED